VTLYARVAEGELDRCRALLAALAETGFGKRRSVGYGALGPPEWSREEELGTAPARAAGWVSLCAFIPREEDSTDGAWRVRQKSPRFGDDVPGSPAKTPLLFLETGAVFRDEPLRRVAGCVVERIAGHNPPEGLEGAVQYAFAFPIPTALAPEGTT
jgi:CRISPR/Cas system CSM-associated protein Csm4 (group 5 of RAMP superfamily)